ncbi:MAG: 2-hydroxyacyl-CoA dehydratase family protein [Synergistaceae bacterium]|jgi:benzoyl-CoA reductase/2-hydroxyglutaryl-CoA dehydratase subunit BcrC/BadD/HgdB|nr:2-hydroxyacyl-CoA dehydratase family protein [Synergistaceae bacterium]
MTMDDTPGKRLAKKLSDRVRAESERAAEALRSRPDYSRTFGYFLELAEKGPGAVLNRTGRETVSMLCVQVPPELVHAAGLQPFKIWGGSSWNFSPPEAPTLMCPMLKASMAVMGANENFQGRDWVVPTTCDWVVKFPEIASRVWKRPAPRVFWLELPHLKERPYGGQRWLEEMFRLKDFLESIGEKITGKSLARSAALYARAWRAMNRLSDMRRDGALPPVWFMLIMGTFFLDSPERWTEAAENVTPSPVGNSAVRVFLAGSPIFFPNLKLPLLLEEAGLYAAADDLCSSGRVIPGAVTCHDTSEFGVISAVAERYHRACLCPIFIDNDRRVNNILGRRKDVRFDGVIFHVLKGCHPYDIESLGLESELKRRGLRFLRLETDHTPEDSRNLFARLEAFHNTVKGGFHDRQDRA